MEIKKAQKSLTTEYYMQRQNEI